MLALNLITGVLIYVALTNTEPVVRLNLETRGDKALMQQKTDEILALLRQ